MGGKGRGRGVWWERERCGEREGERYRGVWWEEREEVQRCVVGGKGRGTEVCGGREGER